MAKKLSPLEQKSSKTVLDALRGETQNMLKGKMDGLKKVTVASNSPEGLKKGLDLAKKIAGKPQDEESNEGSEGEELLESPEEEASELEDGSEVEGLSAEEEAMSPSEIDNLIAKLQELKAKKQ